MSKALLHKGCFAFFPAASRRSTIGKRSEEDRTKMQPNENYLKFFPDEEIPETMDRTRRSSCLRIGSWLVIRKIIEEYKLTDIL